MSDISAARQRTERAAIGWLTMWSWMTSLAGVSAIEVVIYPRQLHHIIPLEMLIGSTIFSAAMVLLSIAVSLGKGR